MFLSRVRRCGYIVATLWVAVPPVPAVSAFHRDSGSTEHTPPATRAAIASLGGLRIAARSSDMATCDFSWLTECNASEATDQAAASGPSPDSTVGPSETLNVGGIDLETGPCVDRPWSDCGTVEELPGSERISATVDDMIDRMIRDSKAAATPFSPLKLRTVGHHVPKGQIVILTSERRLLYFFQDDIAIEFAVGVARRNLQRLGSTVVTLKRRDPTWVPTAQQHRVYRNLPASVGPGPKNPLGTRALNLAIPNIRIHGTNDDGTIDKSLSDGCFHMYNRDIEYLFEIVPVGTRVTILK